MDMDLEAHKTRGRATEAGNGALDHKQRWTIHDISTPIPVFPFDASLDPTRVRSAV